MGNESVAPNRRVSNEDIDRAIAALRKEWNSDRAKRLKLERRVAELESRLAKLEPVPDPLDVLPPAIRQQGAYIHGQKVFNAANLRVGSIVDGAFTTEIV